MREWNISLPQATLLFIERTRTGYVQIKETNRALFGEEMMENTKPVYGLDEEGELRGSYRPSGHPGVSCPPHLFLLNRL